MKKLFIIASLGVFLTACETKQQNLAELVHNPISAEGGNVEENAAKMTFEELEWDFGTIKQGEVVEHDFVFKNTGKADLVITNTKTSCGCTVPDYPKDPVKVGSKGKISVKFDSAGKSGQVEKTVAILANTIPTETKIKIKTNIVVN